MSTWLLLVKYLCIYPIYTATDSESSHEGIQSEWRFFFGMGSNDIQDKVLFLLNFLKLENNYKNARKRDANTF